MFYGSRSKQAVRNYSVQEQLAISQRVSWALNVFKRSFWTYFNQLLEIIMALIALMFKRKRKFFDCRYFTLSHENEHSYRPWNWGSKAIRIICSTKANIGFAHQSWRYINWLSSPSSYNIAYDDPVQRCNHKNIFWRFQIVGSSKSLNAKQGSHYRRYNLQWYHWLTVFYIDLRG